MPGSFIHVSAMRATAERLARGDFAPQASERVDASWVGRDPKELGALMKAHANFASLGAIGPDLFFFLPDFRDIGVGPGSIPTSSVLVEFTHFLMKVYDALDPYIEKYEKYLGPLVQNLDEEISRLTGGMSELVSGLVNDLLAILITLIEDFATQNWDLFTFFSLGLNKGWDEQAFLWSDMLHYRRTGQFGRALYTLAQQLEGEDRDKASAYALGYLTHIGTDVTGHGLVNEIAGGPFRLHWQRHHLVENHMDAFWYLKDPLRPGNASQYGQLTESALYYDIAFNEEGGAAIPRPAYPSGNSMRERWQRRRTLDLDSKLADPIPELLVKALEQVFYQGGKHPRILADNDGKPSAELIRETYRLLFLYLRMTTADGFDNEPPEPPDVFPNLDFPVFSDAQDEGPNRSSDDGDWFDDLLDFLLSVAKVIIYIAQVAAYIGSLPFAVAADLGTYPLRYAYYWAVQLPLFHMLKNARSVLVMTGYLLPMKDEISVGLITVGLPDSAVFRKVMDDVGDIFGGTDPAEGHPGVMRDGNYPHLYPVDGDGDPAEFRAPWVYPATPPPEFDTTTAAPHARGAGPQALFDTVPTDVQVRDALEGAQQPNEVDAANVNLLTPTRHLGDAVSFSSYLIWLESRSNPQPQSGHAIPCVDWNLDADRGYGYHCWDLNRKPGLTHQDPNGHDYDEPCTWPVQVEDGNGSPAPRLQLHWSGFGLEDPGCGDEPRLRAADLGLKPRTRRRTARREPK
jgi:hypothetical protein